MTNMSTGLQRLASVALVGILAFLPAIVAAQNGAPAVMQAVTPTSQQAFTSTPVPQPPGVVVRDSSGNPLRGVIVLFIPSGGAGAVSPTSVVSGADGIARLTSWTAGSALGTNTVFAKVTRLPALVFTATTVSPAPIVASATQRTTAPTSGAGRLPALTVSPFTISNGSATTSDRDVTVRFAFDGTTALYRIGEGARPTGGWGVASDNALSIPLQLISGPEGTRTLYLEIQKDASSPTTIRTASIQLKYPRQDVALSGSAVQWSASRSQFDSSATMTSPSGLGCTMDISMTAGVPAGRGTSPETVCEFKYLSGRKLKAGWTLKSAKVSLVLGGTWQPIAGQLCIIKSAAWGTDNPELTIYLRHPGSINPFDRKSTVCRLDEVVFRGPNDPNITEGAPEVLSASW